MKEIMKSQPFTVRVWTTDIGFRRDGDVFVNDQYKLEVSVSLENFIGTSATKQVNTITNRGEQDVVLSGFSSAVIKTSRGIIGVDRNRWQVEGQWNFFTPLECGLVPPINHAKYVIASTGSWSTRLFYPLTVVLGEDGFAYYMELEGAHNWQLTHYTPNASSYELEGTSASEENGGWTYVLKPGESYTTQPAVFGRVEGGFEEVCADLVAYKRATSLTGFEGDTIPVVFNDYMNCLWAKPSDKKLLPLIDAAAKVGCEYFCIDAGWFTNANSGNVGWYASSGDWIVANERFGEMGLSGVFAHMKEKGLLPGIWFEFDTVNASAASHDLGEDENGEKCLLSRYGKEFPRSFFNFRNKKVRAHLRSRVAELYGMGVRYIKNDYNDSTGIGCDSEGNSPAEGLVRNYEAFVSFIDELREEFPDLVIENCGSGACRADHGTLRHFHLQSTSDQTIYYNYPSIVIGSAAQYAPEKAGIWSYPMPLHANEQETVEFDDEWRARFADGEETIFNMVSGMCGALYMSGHIEHADEKNLALVAEGIAAYKAMRGDIRKSHPIFPTGTLRMTEEKNAAFGLENPGKTRAYLAVWRIGTDDEVVKLDLSRYGYKTSKAFYPASGECEFADGVLTVKLPKKYSARMILLEK